MIHSNEITCPHCDNNDLVKNGHVPMAHNVGGAIPVKVFVYPTVTVQVSD